MAEVGQQLVMIIAIGAAAQWLAWRLRFPSIVFLLLGGFLAGPVAGAWYPQWRLMPNELFGELLLPVVSLSVAIILFEGGLTLRFTELRAGAAVIRNLVTVGALATWIVSAAAAHWIVGLSLPMALLLGAILTVTGPTVILPLLQHVRPSGAVGPILQREGIVIDPIGALLAVLVFEVISGGELRDAPLHVVLAVLKTLVIAGTVGVAAGGLLALLISRFWVPMYLHNIVALMFVFCVFAGSNRIQPESGLFAVTAMGIALGNQRFADTRHIVEFKENLRVFLISTLFIVLSARLEFADLQASGVGSVLLVLVLIVLARPACILISTIGSTLKRNERLFLMAMARRGIVAAAVASVFALYLEDRFDDAKMLVPITFGTIIGTVLFYGLLAPWAAQRLGLAEANPQGLLIAGADAVARAIAKAVKDAGFRVLLVDTNRANIAAARMANLPTYAGSIIGSRVAEELDLSGLGRILALTPSNEVNVMAVRQFIHEFGVAEAYQLRPKGNPAIDRQHHGRWLFGEGATHSLLAERIGRNFVVKATKLSKEFDYAAFKTRYGPTTMPLFVVSEGSRLGVATADRTTEPKPGQTVIAIVPPDEELPSVPTNESGARAPSTKNAVGGAA